MMMVLGQVDASGEGSEEVGQEEKVEINRS